MATTRLKDHAVFFVAGVCAATAAATWAVSENVRVKPLADEVARATERVRVLEEQRRRTVSASAPVITDVQLTKVKTDAGYDLERSVFFRDAEGDATYVSFVIVATNAERIEARSFAVDVPAEQQVKGGVIRRTWRCGNGGYFVRLRVLLTDAAGNLSAGKDVALNC